MSQLILVAKADARELIEQFSAEHPEQTDIETKKGADGATLFSLIIENVPRISASLALLIATLQKRALIVKVRRDGIEIGIDKALDPA